MTRETADSVSNDLREIRTQYSPNKCQELYGDEKPLEYINYNQTNSDKTKQQSLNHKILQTTDRQKWKRNDEYYVQCKIYLYILNFTDKENNMVSKVPSKRKKSGS